MVDFLRFFTISKSQRLKAVSECRVARSFLWFCFIVLLYSPIPPSISVLIIIAGNELQILVHKAVIKKSMEVEPQ